MNIAHGILTIRGGMTSHAAVVARGMGTCCVCGCGSLRVDEEAKVLMTPDGKKYHEGEKYFTVNGLKFTENDYISLDGSTGNVYGERIKTVEPEISGDFETFMSWADDVRTLKVRTNADTPRDALQARKFGAEGIGLCRTEHMFFEEERIFNFRRMITAETVEARKEALEKILPYQRSDFKELFKAMEIYPVTIRFLDPPLHEFLPHTDEEIRPLAESLGMTFDALKARVESLKEFNPMMGHRGCRLAVTYPEIAEMQTRAVIEAAIAVNKEGQNVVPEIMIPLVGDIKELKYVKDVVCKTADAIIEEAGVELPYKVGTMIEIPRAALTADEIAKEAEFFSFGTNDLTQMTYGFSRDDAAKFLNEYYTKNIFESDPFAHIDENGVGQLMQIAINKAKPVRPDIKLGICGEHGGDPRTVEFCHRIGLTYAQRDGWSQFYKAEERFNSTDPSQIISKNITSDLKQGKNVWLTDINKMPDNIVISDNDDMGFMYLMMEFEVTGGTVNFATMAMADSSDFDNVFDLNQAKPTYDEATGMIKGKGEFGKVVESDVLEYYIDDTVAYDTKLTFKTDPIIPNNGNVTSSFITNASPLYYLCKDRVPISSSLGLAYDAYYSLDTGEEKYSGLFFDTYHSPKVNPYIIPEVVKVGPYAVAQKTTWETNEEFNNQWFNILANTNYDSYGDALSENLKKSAKDFENFLGETNMQGYGVTFKYNIVIHNLSDTERQFVYHAAINRRYRINCYSNGNLLPINSNAFDSDNHYEDDIYTIQMAPNETANIVIESTELAGASATCENWFRIQ